MFGPGRFLETLSKVHPKYKTQNKILQTTMDIIF